MFRHIIVAVAIVIFAVVSLTGSAAFAGQYLVKGSGGPGPGSPAEAVALLENLVLPTFDLFVKWEKEGKIVGGLPVGGRAFIMIVNAESNHEVDQMVRSIPLWPMLNWKVIPLESASARAATERQVVKDLKKDMK